MRNAASVGDEARLLPQGLTRRRRDPADDDVADLALGMASDDVDEVSAAHTLSSLALAAARRDDELSQPSAARRKPGLRQVAASSPSRSSRRVYICTLPSAPRPSFLGAIPIELDAVLVGIAQIERFRDPVVAGAVERDAGRDQPAQRIGELGPRRIEDGEMVEAGRAGRRRLPAGALPGVQPDMVMIAAGRDEGRLRPVALHQLEAEHAAIESERTIKIRDLQMHMADADTGIDRAGEARACVCVPPCSIVLMLVLLVALTPVHAR